MECSIRKGSVIMEFVIMLPFYLLLLGAAVLLGDVALRSIWVTHGDVLAGYSKGDNSTLADTYLRTVQLPMMTMYDYDVGGLQSQDFVASDSACYRAKESFKGAWGWQTAGKVTDYYALPPWARAWLIYADETYRYGSHDGYEGDFALFLKNMVGRQPIISREEEKRKFRAYSLMRTAKARNLSQPYRRWKAQDLSDCGTLGAVTSSHWYKNVLDEPFFDSKAENLDNHTDQKVDEYPKKPSGRDDFPRSMTMEPLCQ